MNALRQTIYAVLGLIASLLAIPAQAVLIDVGSQTGTFTGNTRGFYFTAPSNFRITGLGVPTDASSANFDLQALRLNVSPPLFPADTTDFDILFTARDVAGAGLVPTDISISAGDIVGILGSRGANSTNSYGVAPYDTNIFGDIVTLRRFLMQADLRTTDASVVGVSTESGRLGRVLVDIEQIPEPATVALLGLGIAGIGYQRRKRLTPQDSKPAYGRAETFGEVAEGRLQNFLKPPSGFSMESEA